MKNEEIIYKSAKKLNSFRELLEDSAKKYGEKNAFIIKEKLKKILNINIYHIIG